MSKQAEKKKLKSDTESEEPKSKRFHPWSWLLHTAEDCSVKLLSEYVEEQISKNHNVKGLGKRVHVDDSDYLIVENVYDLTSESTTIEERKMEYDYVLSSACMLDDFLLHSVVTSPKKKPAPKPEMMQVIWVVSEGTIRFYSQTDQWDGTFSHDGVKKLYLSDFVVK